MKPIQIVFAVLCCIIMLVHEASSQSKPDITLYGRIELMGFGQSVTDQVEPNGRIYLYLKQARFGITGAEEDIKLDVQVAFGGEDVIVAPNPGISLQLLDFSIDAPLASSLRFKAGQFKVPYGREGLTNSGYLSFGDRSIQYNAFIVGRDVGGALYGTAGTFTGALGIFTGGGRDIPIKYLPEKLGLPMIVLRAGINNGYDEDILTVKQTDYNVSSGSAFYVNALYTKDSRIGHSTVLNVKSSDKSLLLDGNWNPFIAVSPLDRGTLWQAGVDAAYRSSMSGTGFLFGEAEINFGGFKNMYGSLTAVGGRIQIGIDQKPYEFAIRYAFLQPDSKFAYVAANHQQYPIVNDQLIHEVTLGVSYFLKNHMKITADLPILFQVPVINDPVSGAYVLTQQPDQVVYVATGGKIDRQTVMQARLKFIGKRISYNFAGTPRQMLMIRVLAILLISLSTIFRSSLCQEQSFVPYHLLPGSRLWIDGTATLGSYTCETVAVYGSGGLNADLGKLRDTSLTHQAGSGGVQVFVLVKMFDCGNPAMNADMYHALRAERDSAIEFTLIKAQVMYDSIAHNGWLGLKTIGKLSIAGVARMDTINVRVKSLRDRKYEILGRKELSMLDFHITPPSAFFGLIKADEGLVVNFDLIAGPDHIFTEMQDENHTHGR